MKNMPGFISGWRLICLLLLGGMAVTPLHAQTPTVPSDRLAWTQSADQIGLFTFAVVIDGTRSPLSTATCAPSATAGLYDCVSPLPALTAGTHEIRVMAIRTENGFVAESPLSEPLIVNVIIVSAPTGLRIVRS